MIRIFLFFLAFTLILCSSTIADVKYPSRAVTIVVPWAPGGAADITSRFIGDAARKKFGVPVTVENRPGAGGTFGLGQIARAKPDGYTISEASSSPLAVVPHFQKLPYDAENAFTYLCQYLVIPHPAFVKADSPFKTWGNMIDYARVNPGKLRWATSAARGGPHIATEAALKKEGVKTTYVPFNGGSEAITALLGNHIEMVVVSDYGPFIDAGQIRLLAEIGSNKLPGMTDIPTFKELNYPLALSMFFGLVGPAKLPVEVTATWEKLLQEIIATPAWADLMKTFKATSAFQNSSDFTKTCTEMYREVGTQVRALGFTK
jgi:tripartite-type tricarboxylate transporter receptor subunit TctC